MQLDSALDSLLQAIRGRTAGHDAVMLERSWWRLTGYEEAFDGFIALLGRNLSAEELNLVFAGLKEFHVATGMKWGIYQPRLNRVLLERMPSLPEPARNEALRLLYLERDPAAQIAAEPLILQLFSEGGRACGYEVLRLAAEMEGFPRVASELQRVLEGEFVSPGLRDVALRMRLDELPEAERIAEALRACEHSDPELRRVGYGFLSAEGATLPRLLEAWRSESDPECFEVLIERLAKGETWELVLAYGADPSNPAELRASALSACEAHLRWAQDEDDE